jgi:hypothetical protein
MKTRPDRWLVATCLVCLAQPAAFPKDFEHQVDAKARVPVTAAMAEAPMCFEQNVGQSDERVAFLARGSGCGIFLTADELVLSLRRAAPAETAERSEQLAQAVLRMRLVGASPSTPVGEQQLETRTNYFIGDDPDQWHADVPNFARVRYPEVYPGVDLVYYGRGGQLEYDEVVAPGVDPSGIVMEWDGADSVNVDETGDLVLKVDGFELRQHAPVLYQETEAGRAEVAGRFLARGGRLVGVEVGNYDTSKPLVIDPVLAYSTYLGGNDYDWGWGIAVDSSGAVYVIGDTKSPNFPTQNAYDATFTGTQDIFVSKLDPSGSTLVYSTYLGGSSNVAGDVVARDIAVDSSGAAYVLGQVIAGNFPTMNAYDASYNGHLDTVVAKLSPAGNSLVYSTYLGGTGDDFGNAIAVDSSGAAYVTGAASAGFATQNAYDASFNGALDVFVTKLNPGGNTLAYSTYLGGTDGDEAWDIAVDWTRQVYVTGSTNSSDFPVQNALDATYNGDRDVFVAKLSSAGSTLVYSTFLGGTGNDLGNAIVVDASGAAYVTGGTDSQIFPTLTSSFDPIYNGSHEAFVTKLNPAGNSLVYSTYLGGSIWDDATDLAVDSSGAAYVTGQTNSSDFPVQNAYDATVNASTDVFVTKLDPGGHTLAYSTFLGGTSFDMGYAIAVDASGAAYVLGETSSLTFPTTPGAFDRKYNGDPYDAVVTKLQ